MIHATLQNFARAIILLMAGLALEATRQGYAVTPATGPSAPGKWLGPTTRPVAGKAAFPFRPAQIGQVVFVLDEPELLRHELPKMVLRHSTLNHALDELARSTHTNLVASWNAMVKDGLSMTARQSLTLPANSYKRDMVLLMKHFMPHRHLVITAQSNVIFITTQAQDDLRLVVRYYWLPDLLQNLPRIIHPGTNLETYKPTASAKAPTTAPATQPKKSPPISTNIIDLITSTVRPKIWLNHGGKGTISIVGERVIVSAPANVQAMLNGPSHYNPNAAPLYLTVSY
ncbi:MAG: hypothetical protein HKL96_06610 [Phycisphaerales bacterium]|nr:hypothetical protein [Phycisphaerales bacterium]